MIGGDAVEDLAARLAQHLHPELILRHETHRVGIKIRAEKILTLDPACRHEPERARARSRAFVFDARSPSLASWDALAALQRPRKFHRG